jgi:hypothetical protein
MKFLWSAKRDAVEIHRRFLRAGQEDAYPLWSVYKCIEAFKTGRTSLLDELEAGWPRPDHIDSKIFSLFTENEFYNVRTLTHELRFL